MFIGKHVEWREPTCCISSCFSNTRIGHKYLFTKEKYIFSRCYSYVGRIGGAQKLSLGYGCVYEYIIIHEFMHAAGFHHEQSRYDRDTYVRINYANIQDGKSNNFNKYSSSQIQHLGEPYDYSESN